MLSSRTRPGTGTQVKKKVERFDVDGDNEISRFDRHIESNYNNNSNYDSNFRASMYQTSNSDHYFRQEFVVVMDENFAEQMGLIPPVLRRSKEGSGSDIIDMMSSVLEFLPHKEILPFIPKLAKGFGKKPKLNKTLIPKGSILESVFDDSDDDRVEDITEKEIKRKKK